VAKLVAVQAQDYSGAKWALGLRLHRATDDAVERAFAKGAVLLTHLLRPTWHFVTPRSRAPSSEIPALSSHTRARRSKGKYGRAYCRAAAAGGATDCTRGHARDPPGHA
jgi:hypothetical protein